MEELVCVLISDIAACSLVCKSFITSLAKPQPDFFVFEQIFNRLKLVLMSITE
jgi:hypothetical protein